MNIAEINHTKTVIMLSSGKRLPHLEKEIFSNTELTSLYLQNLWQPYDRYASARSNEYIILCYARDIIKDPWADAEFMIRHLPKYAIQYSIHVIKERWPEAEPFIKRSYFHKLHYCRHFNCFI